LLSKARFPSTQAIFNSSTLLILEKFGFYWVQLLKTRLNWWVGESCDPPDMYEALRNGSLYPFMRASDYLISMAFTILGGFLPANFYLTSSFRSLISMQYYVEEACIANAFDAWIRYDFDLRSSSDWRVIVDWGFYEVDASSCSFAVNLSSKIRTAQIQVSLL